MWFVFALLSALLASVRRMNEKRISQNLHYFTVGWAVQALSLPVTGLALALSGQWLNPLHVPMAFWAAVLVTWLVYYPFNTFCYVNAYKHGELSKILPLQSLSPVFTMLAGWAAFGQRPTVATALALGIVMVSVYVLNMKGRRMHNPLHMFTADKPNLYMLGSIVSSALVGLLNVVAVRASNPLFYAFVSALGAVPVLYLAARLKGAKESRVVRNYLPLIALSGLCFGLSYPAYLQAITQGPLAYVDAVRSSSVFMGSAIGILWFSERLTRQKVIAGVGMAMGLVLLAFAS